MAEGGKFSETMEVGSDMLCNHECTQCQTDGTKQEASHMCQDCKQFLCQTCGKYHIRNMRNHTLLEVALLKHSKKSLSVPVLAKCHYHPDRDIEMYCGTHDMVYCSLCIAKNHRSCSDVNEIMDVEHKVQFSTLLSLVDDIAKVNEQLHAAKLRRSKDLELIKKKKADLHKEINEVRKRMNKHLDDLEAKIIAELELEQKQLERKIKGDMGIADDLINATDKHKPDLTSNYDEKQTFVIEKLGRVVLAEAYSFIKGVNASEHPTMKFESNVALCDAICKSDCMGNIIGSEAKPKQVQQRNYTVKKNCNGSYLNSVDTRITSDQEDCDVNAMCILPDGTILLTDCKNNKLKRLEKLKVKDFCTLKARPMGLCSVSHTEVAVRLHDKTIQFISVGQSLSYQGEISLNDLTNASDGMACCTDQFWIPGKGAVYIYSLSGGLVKKVETDFHDRKIFPNCDPLHIAVSNDETQVYVAAWDDRVVVFNSDGDVVNEFCDERLGGASCICVTEDDVVLVAGLNSIIMFDRDGNTIGAIVNGNQPGYLIQPGCELLSSCYDIQKHRLFMGFSYCSYRNAAYYLELIK